MADITISVDTSGVDRGTKSLDKMGLSAVRLAQDIVKFEAMYSSLDKAFNKGYISAQKYAEGVQQLDSAIDRLKNTGSAVINSQNAFAKNLQSASQAVEKQTSQIELSQKANRRFQVGIQQAGYQVGDFFVQVASGTSPMVAFTQQATQLVGFFAGPWGAVIGAALSIFGALGIAISATGDKTTKVSFDFSKFGQDMLIALKPIQPLIDGIGYLFSAFVDLVVDGINLVLNSLRYFGAAVGAIPDAFDAMIAKTDAKMFQLELVISGYAATIKATLQDMFDVMSGSPSMTVTAQGIPISVADKFRSEAEYFQAAAIAEGNRVASMPGPGDVIGKALSDMSSIDIRNYFSTNGTKKGGGGSKGQTFDEYIKGLEEEVALQQRLIGLYGVSAEIEKARADAAKAMNTTVDKLNPKEIERIDALTKQSYALEQQQQIVDTAYNSINDSLLSLVDGSKSVSSAFKDMMTSILKSIYEQMVTKPLASAGANLFSSLISGVTGVPVSAPAIPSAYGNVFNAGNLQAFATGGVVGSPTLFPMAGGKTGLMGEAGPEAIMPLKRGPDGKLGVASSGGGNITVNNVINVTGTGDAAYVRSEVAKLMPQITGATKAAVIDARKRGGQMASAFR